jgi:hypothetical protein
MFSVESDDANAVKTIIFQIVKRANKLLNELMWINMDYY